MRNNTPPARSPSRGPPLTARYEPPSVPPTHATAARHTTASAASKYRNRSPTAPPSFPSRLWRRRPGENARRPAPGGRPSFVPNFAGAWQWFRTRRSGDESISKPAKEYSTAAAPKDKGLACLNVDADEVLACLEMERLDTLEVLVIDYVEVHRLPEERSSGAAYGMSAAAIYQTYSSQDGSLYGSCLLKTNRQNHFRSRSTQTKKLHVEEILDNLANVANWGNPSKRSSRRYRRLRLPMSESVDIRGKAKNYLLAYENPSRTVKAIYVKIFRKETDAFLEPRLSAGKPIIII